MASPYCAAVVTAFFILFIAIGETLELKTKREAAEAGVKKYILDNAIYDYKTALADVFWNLKEKNEVNDIVAKYLSY